MVSKGKGLNLPAEVREGGGGMEGPKGMPIPVLARGRIALVGPPLGTSYEEMGGVTRSKVEKEREGKGIKRRGRNK